MTQGDAVALVALFVFLTVIVFLCWDISDTERKD